MSKLNFEMGKAVDLKVDPAVCQSPQDCAQGPIDANNNQNTAVNVLTGGVRKKHRKGSKSHKLKGGVKFPEPSPPAGYYEVKPLPLGTQTTNTTDNNMEMNEVYASTQMNSKGDSEVKFGGRRSKRKNKTTKKKTKRKGGGRKTTCVKQTRKKYITRKSPPYPANQCKNKKKKGNDGKFYISKVKGGTYKWVSFAKKK